MKIPARLTALSLAAGLLAGAAPAASAQTGPALQSARDCGVHAYVHNSRGVVMPKAGGALRGSYRFHMYETTRGSTLDIRMSGRVDGRGRGDTVLGRAQFELDRPHRHTDWRLGGPQVASLRADPELRASLQVYDDRGRLTCQASHVLILPMEEMGRHGVAPVRPGPLSPF